MNDNWEDGFHQSMLSVSSFVRANSVLNLSETSWHPYTNVPFTIDKNTLSFDLKPWFKKFIVDKIYFECCECRDCEDVPDVLEVSIDNRSVKYQQNSNIITINQLSQLHDKVLVIFDHTPNIAKLCVSLIQCNPTIYDFKLSESTDYAKGKKYDFGPFSEATFDRKYLPKNFCLRKILIKEPCDTIIATDQNYLFRFYKNDFHQTKNKRLYQIKLKCDYPIFHVPPSQTKILCKSEFTLRGVIDPDRNAEEILKQPSITFVTETTRVIDYDSNNFKLDNRDTNGELFLKYMTIESDSSFVGKVGMRFEWDERNAIWDNAENYCADGWIRPVVGFKHQKSNANEIIIPFSSNPKSMIPHSYLFMNRCDYFQILTNLLSARGKVRVKLCCLQIIRSQQGLIGRVFDC
jgi:hypothetical protein